MDRGNPHMQIPFSPLPRNEGKCARLVSRFSPSTNSRVLAVRDTSPGHSISLQRDRALIPPLSPAIHHNSPTRSTSSGSLNSPQPLSPITPHSAYSPATAITCPSDSPGTTFSSYFQDVDSGQNFRSFMADLDSSKEKNGNKMSFDHDCVDKDDEDERRHAMLRSTRALEKPFSRNGVERRPYSHETCQPRPSGCNLREQRKDKRRLNGYRLSKIQSEACLPSFRRRIGNEEDEMNSSLRTSSSSCSSLFPMGLNFPRPPSTNLDTGSLFTEEETKEVREFLRVWGSHVRRRTASESEGRLSIVPPSLISGQNTEGIKEWDVQKTDDYSWEVEEQVKKMTGEVDRRSHDSSVRCSKLLEEVSMMVGLRYEEPPSPHSLDSPISSTELLTNFHREDRSELKPLQTSAPLSGHRTEQRDIARSSITEVNRAKNICAEEQSQIFHRGLGARNAHDNVVSSGKLSKRPSVCFGPDIKEERARCSEYTSTPKLQRASSFSRESRTTSKRWGQLINSNGASTSQSNLSGTSYLPNPPLLDRSSALERLESKMKDWNGHISLQSGPRCSVIAGENPTSYRRGILTKQNSTPAMKVSFPVIETVPKLNDATGTPRPAGSSRFRRFSNPIRHLSKPLPGTSTASIQKVEPYPGGSSRFERPPLRGTRSHSPMPRYQQTRTNDTNKTHLRSFIDMGVAPGQRPAPHRSHLRPTMNVEKVKRLARAAVRTSYSVVEWGRNLAGLKKEKSDLL